MYHIIEHFGERPPQCLLRMQKTFLLMNIQHSDRESICSATLAKYVLEKWRSALPGLKLGTNLNRTAKQHYRANTLKKSFIQLAKYSKQVRQQSCITILMSQTHDDNLLQTAFNSLKKRAQKISFNKSVVNGFAQRRIQATQKEIVDAWRCFSARRAQLQHVEEVIKADQLHKLGQRYLSLMRMVSLRSATNQSIVQSFDTRRDQTLCWQVFQVLANYSRCQQKHRKQSTIVDTFRRRLLFKRVMLSLKL